MSAASRSIQAAPRAGQLGIMLAAILVAAVLVALVAVARPTVPNQQAAPAAGSAPTLHDRGWATAGELAPAGAPVLHDRGASTVATQVASAPTTFYTGIPYTPTRSRDADAELGARRHR
jgi:hypothetical protein